MALVASAVGILRRFLPTVSIAAVTALLITTTAFAQSASTIITFDAPGAGRGIEEGTLAFGMNSQGTIVGSVTNSNRQTAGFLRRPDGTMQVIRVPGASSTGFDDINDSGTMVGSAEVQGSTGFIRTKDGRFSYFLPENTQFLEDPIKIDNLGNVAGTIIDNNDVFECFIRTADGTITNFTPPGGFGCQTGGIVAGTVSGTYGASSGFQTAFLRHPDGTFTVFLVGYQTGSAVLNAEGTAAGSFSLSDGSSHGYIRTANGAITYFSLSGATEIVVDDINSTGALAGTYTNDPNQNSAFHGYRRSPDGSMNPFDAPGSGTGFFQGTFPMKINDAGNITGYVGDSSSVFHGLLLTP